MIKAALVAADVARICFGKSGCPFVSLTIFLSAAGFLNVTLMQTPRPHDAIEKSNQV